jgi:hypothetical protein
VSRCRRPWLTSSPSSRARYPSSPQESTDCFASAFRLRYGGRSRSLSYGGTSRLAMAGPRRSMSPLPLWERERAAVAEMLSLRFRWIRPLCRCPIQFQRANSKHTFTPSRREAPEALLESSAQKRAWGMPGARCTRGLVCTCSGRTHTSNNEYTGITRHSRTQWF